MHRLIRCGEVVEHGWLVCPSWEPHVGSSSKRPDMEPVLAEDVVGFHAPVDIAHADHGHPERGGGHGSSLLGLQLDRRTSGSERDSEGQGDDWLGPLLCIFEHLNQRREKAFIWRHGPKVGGDLLIW